MNKVFRIGKNEAKILEELSKGKDYHTTSLKEDFDVLLPNACNAFNRLQSKGLIVSDGMTDRHKDYKLTEKGEELVSFLENYDYIGDGNE